MRIEQVALCHFKMYCLPSNLATALMICATTLKVIYVE